MRDAGQGRRAARAAPLLALLAALPLGACAAGQPGAPLAAPAAPPPATATAAEAARPPDQGPAQAPGVAAPPDRARPPWSSAPVPLLAIGAVETGQAAGGAWWRIGTPRGAVVAWRPAGYHPREAGVVVYLHGYFTTVDQAVADHRLFEQFRQSGRSALFIAPEGPAWNGEDPVWPDLAALVGEVCGRTGLTPPRGPLVVAAHSGGYRTTLLWLGDGRLEEILLLDGLYRGEEQLRGWLEAPTQVVRRLVLVGDETRDRAEALAAATPGAVTLPRVPPLRPGLEGAARTARLVAIRSQLPHMAIVERGEVLPVLLRATRLAPAR
jgi:hypothetical protein